MTSITTSVVGSYTRPDWLISAINDSKRGSFSPEALEDLKNQAKILTIKEQEVANLDVLTDGEQGRVRFNEYITEGASGFKMGATTRPDNPTAVEKIEYGDKRNIGRPLIVDKLEWIGEPTSSRDARFLKRYTAKRTKMTIASPSMILRRMWVPSEAYPDFDRARNEVVDFTRKEIESLIKVGIDFIQIDSPELSTYADYRVGDEERSEMMKRSVEIINAALPSSKSGVRFGVHVCWGNYLAAHRADGPIASIYPWLLDLNVDQLVLELASARHEDDIDAFKEYPSKMEIGAGVIDIKTPDVEPERIIKKRINRILQFVDKQRLWVNGDCGFAGDYDATIVPRRSCFEKLRSMCNAAAELSEA